ncbi:MAG: hypothetical protein IPM71_00350 [Bacteroidota bacterium]|nr:MAG: hypothetical protein IPM71_00350 [Bacteroidota bacterium]
MIKFIKCWPCALILAAFLITACYYDSKESLFPQTDNACDSTSMTYSGSVEPVISQYCVSCHGSVPIGNSIKLETYADVKIQADNGKLIGSITHASGYSPMPKGSAKLSTCNISILETWVNAGAPNN